MDNFEITLRKAVNEGKLEDLPEIYLAVLLSIISHYEDHRCPLFNAVIATSMLRYKLNLYARQNYLPAPLNFLKNLADVAFFSGKKVRFSKQRCKLTPKKDYQSFVVFLLRQKDEALLAILLQMKKKIEEYPSRKRMFL